ncbi:hypothetical protein SRABI118_03142 [Massilia sp. Bi118]|nr:hypothetical protein SRABI118_03142 [Massilia sp. Bi118]
MLLGAAAHAQDDGAAGPAWTLSGFGTIGAAHSSERNGDYTANVLKANGAGATRSWSANVDSRLGAQLDLRFTKAWSAVLQVVSEQGLDNSYRPRVEWANLKYQATPDLALRFGRIALPMFLTADYRKVGYIYPWVRPPVEGYGALPFTSSDGVDATLRWSAGAVQNSSQLFYGRDDVRLIDPLRATARGIVGISNTSDWGALSVRANLIRAEITTDIGSALFDAYEAAGPAGVAIARNYRIDHKHATIASIGMNYDPGRWFLMAEASRTRSASLLGSTRSMYASAGLRIRSFTPYLSIAQARAVSATHEDGLPTAGLPPAAAAQLAQLNGGLNLLLATIPQQDTQALGVRWDLAANAALKLQYDRVTPRLGSRGTLINLTPAFRSGQTAHVTSVALDFVY